MAEVPVNDAQGSTVTACTRARGFIWRSYFIYTILFINRYKLLHKTQVNVNTYKTSHGKLWPVGRLYVRLNAVTFFKLRSSFLLRHDGLWLQKCTINPVVLSLTFWIEVWIFVFFSLFFARFATQNKIGFDLNAIQSFSSKQHSQTFERRLCSIP